MTRSNTLLLVALLFGISCAEKRLETPIPGEPPVFKFHLGSLADFGAPQIVCVTGSDDMGNFDVTAVILAELKRRIPAFENSCGERPNRIAVHYQSDYSHVTHSSERGPRFGLGRVAREASGGGRAAEATWSDGRGGTAREVAARFGRELASFLLSASEQPPNKPPLPTSVLRCCANGELGPDLVRRELMRHSKKRLDGFFVTPEKRSRVAREQAIRDLTFVQARSS